MSSRTESASWRRLRRELVTLMEATAPAQATRRLVVLVDSALNKYIVPWGARDEAIVRRLYREGYGLVGFVYFAEPCAAGPGKA